ncbi:MFS transporter [Streptomyces sp. NPDC057565]|uniref:MFS transporter n=1 Tax=Streptomyces sp. NPDC057565 TaxID=3346169 RepID=UPI0036BA6A69
MSVTQPRPQSTPSGPAPGSVRGVVGLLVLFELTSGFLQGGITPLIPAIRDMLGISPGTAQWITAVQFLSAAVCVPAFGRLGDRYGHRLMLRVALACVAAGSTLVALAPDVTLLLAGRVLLGPLAALLALEIGLCRDRLGPQASRRAVGLLVSSLVLGSMLGSFTTGLLDRLLGGVRPTLWCFAVLAAACVLLSIRGIPETRHKASGRMDWVGVGLLSVALVLFLAAVSQGGTRGWSSPGTLAGLATALVLFALWVRWELRQEHPLVDVRSAAGRAVAPHLASGFALGVVMLAEPVVAVSYLDAAPETTGYGFGLAAWQIGLWGGIPHLAGFLAAATSASVAARIGLRRMLVLAFGLVAAGNTALVAAHSSLHGFALAYAVAGAGTGLASGGLPTVIVEASPADRSASAVAVYNNLKTLGGSIAGAAFAAILGTLLADGTTAPALSAYLTVWSLCAVVTTTALLLTLLAPRRD